MPIKNKFYDIISFENLIRAEKNTSKGKRYTTEVLSFHNNFEENILDIRNRLEKLDLPLTHYSTFLVYDPKVRIVIYIDYKSKIIQRAIYDILNPEICKMLITDTYSCIEGRGQLKAMQRLYDWFQIQTRSNQKWYYYKFDVSKFFYRIDHEILMNICSKMIKDPYTVELIRYYICSNRRPFGMPIDGNHLTIKEDEMLWECGIPIGGGLSHMLGNMYLDPLDQYAKRTLGIKKYIRYMDDIIIVDCDKQRLKEYRTKMEMFLNDRLKLIFNNKTALRPVNCGCEFVGYNIFPDHVNLRKQTTLRMKRQLKRVANRYKYYEIDFAKANETVQSYLALLKYSDNKRFKEKLWSEFVLTHNLEVHDEQH
ncbi:MAG: reverse transcriptase domain-containing protein [Hespellia sp.]|nr:reverse transcriptase domain-containing protein [Hespellia sp.]